ncbi:MAG: xanthine dehydrogenase family protein subunit M [Gemmatimonadota bacterium]|nr:xanthine dehydrogenase family protein subunit M [Gemmatimonadota bacterium]MDH3422291.1 xanthine dehydrogenase family protein subunit M [Gemmatimonadota bacterium]
MATIKDMIPPFDLVQPTSVDDAVALLREHGANAWVLAGGLDTFDWLKDRIKRPGVVVDIGGIQELHGIRDAQGGLEIGAMATLTEVINHQRVRSEYSLLANAADHVATPQIRNQGTLGGNVSQDTRCWYYRSGWPCYRAGGNTCYASAPVAMNREHAIMGTSRCVAVNPSDTAPALIALDAKMVVQSPRRRTVDAEDYFIGPTTDITRMTILKPGDLLTQIHIPATWANSSFYYEKVRDRGSWDFQLVSVAAAFRMSGSTIEEARIAVNGVAPYPVRLEGVERLVRGTNGDEATQVAAGDLAIAGARALARNDFKIPMMRNLVRRAVRSVA